MPLVLITILLSNFLWAQHSEQPVKEDNTDLRNQSVLFSVEDPGSKKIYWLERTSNLDYFLRIKDKDEEMIRKLASREGAKIDREFSSRFLKCQYELPSVPGECKVQLKLSMKGESQDICHKDEKKSQEIQVFLNELSKRF